MDKFTEVANNINAMFLLTLIGLLLLFIAYKLTSMSHKKK